MTPRPKPTKAKPRGKALPPKVKRLTWEQAWHLFLVGIDQGGDPGWCGDRSTPEQRDIRASNLRVFQRAWDKIRPAPSRRSSR